MKTAIRLTSVVMAVAFCASAFAAEPSKPVVKKNVRKVCYMLITGSGVPQPCDRIRGIPTTASALDVLGNKSPN
jgi:hypothetical protein